MAIGWPERAIATAAALGCRGPVSWRHCAVIWVDDSHTRAS